MDVELNVSDSFSVCGSPAEDIMIDGILSILRHGMRGSWESHQMVLLCRGLVLVKVGGREEMDQWYGWGKTANALRREIMSTEELTRSETQPHLIEVVDKTGQSIHAHPGGMRVKTVGSRAQH